jgi:hypothetical protein
MRLSEAQNRQSPEAWSADEELIIATIQHAESVPRAEAIRRMQRRRKSSKPMAEIPSAPTARRLCRSPRCRRGDDGGPGSLAHLRSDALYCNATCKKAGQRSPKPEKQASNRQCLRGPKRDKSGSLVVCPTPMNMSLKSPAIANSGFGYGDSKGEPGRGQGLSNTGSLRR